MRRHHPCAGHPCDHCLICLRGRCCAQVSAHRRVRSAMVHWTQPRSHDDGVPERQLTEDLAEDVGRVHEATSTSASELLRADAGHHPAEALADLPRSTLPPGQVVLTDLSLAALLEEHPVTERKP